MQHGRKRSPHGVKISPPAPTDPWWHYVLGMALVVAIGLLAAMGLRTV